MNEGSDGADVTSGDSPFQTPAATTGKARSPTVVRRVGGTVCNTHNKAHIIKLNIQYTHTNMWMDCSMKVLCPQNPFLRKLQRYKGHHYVPLCRHTTFVLLTPACIIIIIDKITIFCNDVYKTSISIVLLAINILRYMS